MLKDIGPSLRDKVSEEIDQTWEDYLKTRCEVRGISSDVTYYGRVNCNYLVFRGRIIQNFGYHGRVLFSKLQNKRDQKNWLRGVRECTNWFYISSWGYRLEKEGRTATEEYKLVREKIRNSMEVYNRKTGKR